MRRKKHSDRTLTGQRGINLIESIVLEMGFVWNPTNLDAGIDGTIEIRDPETEEATNFIIQVQSKATITGFAAETIDKFDFYCDESDLEYWLNGNCPVLLICVNLRERKAYWVSIKDYFEDATRIKTRKISFNKSKNRFDPSVKNEIARLAIPSDSGYYFTPPIINELLFSNVLQLLSYPEKIYSADTDYRDPKLLWNDLNNLLDKHGINKSWILQDAKIFSFNDLNNTPWNNVTSGEVTSFPSQKWGNSNDPETKRTFVKLLNSTFESYAYLKKLIRKKTDQFDLYYFKPQLDSSNLPKTIDGKYLRLGRNSKQNVCNRYYRKKDPLIISYFRHLSFEKKFVKLDDKWFLEINPTYLFTHDGFKVHTYYESKLKGKKSLDKAETIFSQVLFWSEEMTKDESLFGPPIFKFSKLLQFNLTKGINDKLWLEKEDTDLKALLISEKGLFE